MNLRILTSGLLVSACATSALAAPKTEVRPVAAFHQVEARGSVAVRIAVAKGAAAKVEVSGEPDDLALITTTVVKGRLVIDQKPSAHLRGNLVVTIATPTLDGVALEGSGSMTASGIDAGSFGAVDAGSGALVLAGTANQLAVELGGSGAVIAKDLTARQAVLSLSGSGALGVTATEAVTVSLDGSGAIDVYGHPRAVTKAIAGSGQLHIH